MHCCSKTDFNRETWCVPLSGVGLSCIKNLCSYDMPLCSYVILNMFWSCLSRKLKLRNVTTEGDVSRIISKNRKETRKNDVSTIIRQICQDWCQEYAYVHDLLTTTSTPTTKPPHTPFMSLTYSTDNYWIEEEPLYLPTRKPSQRGSMFGSIFGIKKHAGSNVIHVSRADKIKLSSQYKKSQFRGRKTWEFSLMNSVIIDIWSSIGEADTSSWRNLRR